MITQCEYPNCDQSAQWVSRRKVRVGNRLKYVRYCAKHADEMADQV